MRQGVEEAVIDRAHSVALATTGFPFAGPVIALSVEAAWAEVGDDVIKAINDTLNFEDDNLDVHSLVISAKQLVTLARAGRSNLEGIV